MSIEKEKQYKICEEFKSNNNINELSIKFNIANQSVRNILKKHNIYKRKTIKWNDKLIEFIKKNYSTLGPKYCAEKLKCHQSKILNVTKYYKIRMNKNDKIRLIDDRINKTKTYKINTNMFLKPNTPEICYLLGLLWADGSLRCGKKKGNFIRITLKKEDADDVIHLFKFSGHWSIKECQYKCHKNPVVSFRCCDKLLYNFLYDMGFYNKSFESAYKILEEIPENLRHYWWRGYFDGDGLLNKNNYGINITSTINQDWSFLNYLPKTIKYKIKKYQRIINNKTQSCSRMLIWGKENVITFLSYIYTGKQFGIKRKYCRYINKMKYGYNGY